MRAFLVLNLLWVASVCLGQQVAPVLLHGGNDLQGVSVGQAAKVAETKLEVSTDTKYMTEGSGCLHISSVSPKDANGNSYLSLVIASEPVNMNGKALVFEAGTSLPENTRALYVRGYDSKGQPVLSWYSWGGPLKGARQTFELTPGVSDATLAWEPGYLKSNDRSAVVRWEFYVGTGKPGTAFDLFLDNLRIVTSNVKSFNDIKEAHKLNLLTPLVAGGKAQAIIVAPADAEWAAIASDLAARIEKASGAKLAVKPGDKMTNAELAAQGTILLGNIGNNRAMLYPYSHMMMFADAAFPGAGGYELRTACDPWGKGTNLIIIGATDTAGAKAGVEALAGQIKPGADLTLGRLSVVQMGSDAKARFGSMFDKALDVAWVDGQQKAAEDGIKNGAHTGLFGQMAGIGESYALTGRPEYAKMFVWLAKRANAHYLTKPDTYGGPWGMDSDFMSHRVFPAWDSVEECPDLTDAERLEVSRILFQYATDACVPEGSGAAGAAANGGMVSNHGTFAALGTYLAGEYFSKYYDASEGKHWVKIGDQCFKNLAACTKAHEDCNGYQWLTNLHNVRYAQMSGDLTIFEKGVVRQMADYALVTMNNLGYQVPYGDTGAWTCWFSEVPVLRAAEWYYGDGRYQWAVDAKVKLTGRSAYGDYETGGTPKAPLDLANCRAWPLEPRYFKADHGEKEIPEAQAFDKIVFRQDLDPKSGYLLLDGLSNGGHRHMDGNSVLQWTENERVWIADADYYKSLPKYHNTVLIVKDGQSAQIPDFVELENVADLPSFAGSTTTYRNYAGVDWQRNVIWLKGRMFVVVDRMIAKEAGDYSFRAVWQTVGDAEIKDSGLSIAQKGQYARFATTPDAGCLLNDDPVTGKNWASYPFASKPLVRVFQAVYNRKLQPGQQLCLFTVLHASGETPSGVKVQRLNDTAAAITGAGEPVVVGVPDMQGAISVPGGPTSRGAAVVFSPQKAFALGVTSVDMQGSKQTFPQGADVEFDLAGGNLVIKAPAGKTAVAAAQTQRLKLPEGIAAAEVRGFIDMAIKNAPPTATAGAAQAQLPSLERRWNYVDKLSSYLLTNNGDAFEAVDTGLKLSVTPQPLAENVFGGGDVNKPDNLTDGTLLTTDGGVMWDVDQEVTVDLTLDQAYDLDRLTLKEWFASSSSKGKLFQLGRLQAIASDDGFQKDKRVLVDYKDAEMRGNWGAPSYGPASYDFANLKAKARSVRLVLTPRPGTAIYLAEVQLWGSRPGLEIDLATRLARGVPVHRFSAIKCADLDGDQVEEVIAGSSNGSVQCFSADGKTLWKLDCGAAVNCVNVVDYGGDGKLTVLAGCQDAKLVAMDAAGKQLWSFSPPYYKRAGHIRTVFPADVAGNGKQIAIVGAENWHYYAVDASGKALWKYESVHASTAGCAADLDGDKKQEIGAGTEYYWWHAINGDGSKRWSYSSGPCVNACAAGDLNGDGKQSIIFGAADTRLHVMSGDGKLAWSVNTGDEVTSLACADVNGDGKEEVLAGSLSFNVYCFDGTGKMLWRQDLGNQVRTVQVLRAGPGVQVAVGCDDGSIHVFNGADGKPSYRYKVGSNTLSMAAGNLGGGGQTLVAGSADGNLTALDVKK